MSVSLAAPAALARLPRGLALVLLLLLPLLGSLLGPWPSLAQEDEPPPPIEGVVVKISQINKDFFVQLDVDADEKWDQWVKVAGAVQSPAGQSLGKGSIGVGTRLRVTDYVESEAGFLDAKKVVVLPEGGGEDGGGSGGGDFDNQ